MFERLGTLQLHKWTDAALWRLSWNGSKIGSDKDAPICIWVQTTTYRLPGKQSSLSERSGGLANRYSFERGEDTNVFVWQRMADPQGPFSLYEQIWVHQPREYLLASPRSVNFWLSLCSLSFHPFVLFQVFPFPKLHKLLCVLKKVIYHIICPCYEYCFFVDLIVLGGS